MIRIRSTAANIAPTITPSMYFEGYITIRQCFDDGTADSIKVENDTYGLGEDMKAIIESEDSMKKAALLALPLGSAVSSGTHMLKASGERKLATSAVFRDRLQDLLRNQYNLAVEAVLPDYDIIPVFPLEQRRLIGALMRGSRSREAVELVHQSLL